MLSQVHNRCIAFTTFTSKFLGSIPAAVSSEFPCRPCAHASSFTINKFDLKEEEKKSTD
jgi:hypothetical protein